MSDVDEKTLLQKLSRIKGLREVTEKAVMLYVLMTDSELPGWVKAVAVGALIYLINPIDAIPDAIPFAGYTDDLGVLIAALKALSDQIKPHHRKRVEDYLGSL